MLLEIVISFTGVYFICAILSLSGTLKGPN